MSLKDTIAKLQSHATLPPGAIADREIRILAEAMPPQVPDFWNELTATYTPAEQRVAVKTLLYCMWRPYMLDDHYCRFEGHLPKEILGAMNQIVAAYKLSKHLSPPQMLDVVFMGEFEKEMDKNGGKTPEHTYLFLEKEIDMKDLQAQVAATWPEYTQRVASR